MKKNQRPQLKTFAEFFEETAKSPEYHAEPERLAKLRKKKKVKKPYIVYCEFDCLGRTWQHKYKYETEKQQMQALEDLRKNKVAGTSFRFWAETQQ